MTADRPDHRLRLALVCSSGGHLLQMLRLRDAWEPYERLWVSFPTEDATSLLADEDVTWAHFPTNRNIPNLIRNLGLAWSFLRTERPDVVISTGAGVAVPFMWLARLFGVRTVYCESITRIHGLSRSGKLVSPIVDKLYVQWPEVAESHRRAEYGGSIL